MTQLVRLDRLPRTVIGGVISIGNFDGVHLGHAALLGEVNRLARQLDGPSVAVILDPHPVSLLRPEATLQKLTTIQRRCERMGNMGIDFLVVCPIDRQFLNLTAEEFFRSLVVDQLQARGMVEGPNFYFGRNRGGNVESLGVLCDSVGIQLAIPGPVHWDDEMISSTRIRAALIVGDIGAANGLLGAPYQVEGIVEGGAKRGRQIGFPTANLGEIPTLVPGNGVYGGITHVAGERLQAAIHIGPNPTFEKGDVRKVEVHLLDYSGDLYGQRLLVDFLTHVRDIARFDSPEQLAGQLALDVQNIRDSLTRIEYSRTAVDKD